MKKLLLYTILSGAFLGTANARDPGLPTGVTCNCEPSHSPLLFTLVVRIPGGYPSNSQTYGPYTYEQCVQAIALIPISTYCNK